MGLEGPALGTWRKYRPLALHLTLSSQVAHMKQKDVRGQSYLAAGLRVAAPEECRLWTAFRTVCPFPRP